MIKQSFLFIDIFDLHDRAFFLLSMICIIDQSFPFISIDDLYGETVRFLCYYWLFELSSNIFSLLIFMICMIKQSFFLVNIDDLHNQSFFSL